MADLAKSKQKKEKKVDTIPNVRVQSHCLHALNPGTLLADITALNAKIKTTPKDDPSLEMLTSQLNILKKQKYTVSKDSVTGLVCLEVRIIRDLVARAIACALATNSSPNAKTRTIDVNNLFDPVTGNFPYIGLLHGLPEFQLDHVRESELKKQATAISVEKNSRSAADFKAIEADFTTQVSALPSSLPEAEKKQMAAKIKKQLLKKYHEANHVTAAPKQPSAHQPQAFDTYIKSIRSTMEGHVKCRFARRFGEFISEVVSASIARTCRVARQTRDVKASKSGVSVRRSQIDTAIVQQLTLAGFTADQVAEFQAYVAATEAAQKEEHDKIVKAKQTKPVTPLMTAQQTVKTLTAQYNKCSPDAIARKQARIVALQAQVATMTTDGARLSTELASAKTALAAAEAQYPDELKAQHERAPGMRKKVAA